MEKKIARYFILLLFSAFIYSNATAQWSEKPLEIPLPHVNQPEYYLPYSQNAVNDGQGGFIVAKASFGWDFSINRAKIAIECQRIDSKGQNLWGNGVVVVPAYYGPMYDYLGMVSDGSGGAIITFDGKAYRVDSNGAKLWGPVAFKGTHWRITSNSHIADGTGGVIITWIEGNYDTSVIHIDGNGKVLWKKILLRYYNMGYMTQQGSVVCSDGEGGVTVVLVDWRFPFLLRAHRISFNGDFMWGQDGIVLDAIDSASPRLAIAPDNAGGVFISRQGDTAAIKVQHVNRSGVLLFNGIVGSGYNHKMVDDGEGGTIFIWTGRPGARYNLYMQHLTYNGDLVLGSEGRQVWDGDLPLTYEVTHVGDGIIVWNHLSDIFKLNGDGKLLWRTSLTDDTSLLFYIQYNNNFVSDNAGGLAAIWSPSVYGNKTLAQRINNDGTVGQISIKAPTNLTAADTPCDNGGSISLIWNKSVDDGAGLNNVTGYNVYRSTASGGSYGKIGNVVAGTISFVDGSAVSGSSYYYVVRATDGSKESSDSNSASASSARNLPLPPANMAASDTPYDLGGSVTLSWVKSVDDGAGLNNVSGYNIYRYSSINGNIDLLLSISAGTISYMDNTTADTDTYYYFIKAIDNQCGMESSASIAASGQSINNFSALPGFISTLPGISAQTIDSLTSKVENAIASFESGNTTAAVNKLNALLSEISAQSGKGIETTTAQTLTTYVQNLIDFINAGSAI